jgi:hypothetical protein
MRDNESTIPRQVPRLVEATLRLAACGTRRAGRRGGVGDEAS